MLKLPAEKLRRAAVRSAIAMVLFFIPILQIYSAAVAFPLFLHPAINAESAYMGYTFAYFFPKSPVTVAIFAIYYLAAFYVVELVCVFINFLAIGPRFGRFVRWLFTFK
jgi:hypothetical protein